MGERQNRPVRLRVFRDEARDVVPLDFGPFLAASRGRVDEDNLVAPGETEPRTSSNAVNGA